MRDHPAFSGTPDHLKIAVDGVWEEAVTVALSDGAAALSGVRTDLATDVACEAFFGGAFFGVRQRGTSEQMAGFVDTFATAAVEAGSGPELFDDVAVSLGIPVASHFRYCELGAEGAWRTVGPLRINDPAAALTDTDALWAQVRSSSVGRDASHPKALEFTYANGDDTTTHWFALPVSEGALIDRAALESALSAFG